MKGTVRQKRLVLRRIAQLRTDAGQRQAEQQDSIKLTTYQLRHR